MTIDSGTGAINIGTGAQARAINLGTGAAVQTVIVGSTNGASALTLNAGSGNAIINATSGTVTIQTTTGGQILIKPVSADGTNIVLGTSDTVGTLLVLDDKTGSGDPTGVAGGMYYNSNQKSFRCYEGDSWWNCREASRTSVHYRTEFMFTTDETPFAKYTFVGDGGFGTVTGVDNHPGIMVGGTGSTSTGSVGIGIESNNDDSILLGNGDTWRYETMVRLPNLSNVPAGQTYTVYLGFTDSGNGDATDGCYFKYSDSINGGKWQGVCADAGSSTCDTASTSGTTVAANTWYRLTVTVNSTGTSTDFQVNGSTTNGSGRCQVTSQIPDTTGNETGANQHITKSAGGTDRTMDNDYIEIYGDIDTR